MNMKISLVALAARGLCAVTIPCLAQEHHPALEDAHTFTIGAYFQQSDTSVGANRNGSDGDTLDLEDLGVDDNYNSWLLGYRWRFHDRWSLHAAANRFQADGDITVSDQFEYNGVENQISRWIPT